MNLLYVAVDPGLYTHYSAGEAYPRIARDTRSRHQRRLGRGRRRRGRDLFRFRERCRGVVVIAA